ncbi:hypothetical protein, partial [Robiginitalea aurantiaca]
SSLVDDADADATNEIQDLGSVLTEGNDAGGAAIANLADPTAAQDAATKAYVDAVADDDVTGAALDGSNVLTISEGTTDVTVDLSSLVDDADADPTNEFNTGVTMNAGALEVTDGGGTESTNLISTDLNNDLSAGADGALYLNVASVTISETITNLTDNADGTLTYVNESGVSQTVSKADISDNGNGTYTFTNNDGTDVIL